MKTKWGPAAIFALCIPIVYLIHHYSMSFFSAPWRVDVMWPTYLFLSVLYEVVFLFLIWLETKYPAQMGFGFLGGGVVKMMAVVIYLLPGLLDQDPDIKPRVVHTMIPYFLFLTIETSLVFRRIRVVV